MGTPEVMNLARTGRLLAKAVSRQELDLSGLTVFTEAATGAYTVTPVLAALAGAEHVYALARENRHATIEASYRQTGALAAQLGVADKIELVSGKNPAHLAATDLLTNCGNVRPLDAATLALLAKPTAVVSLMFEAWEFRLADLDLATCDQRGIAVGATNERHPEIGMFDFLGLLALKLMLDHRFEVRNTRVALLCDNPFAPHLAEALAQAGAEVLLFDDGNPGNSARRHAVTAMGLATAGAAALGGVDAILVAATARSGRALLGDGQALVDVAALAALNPGVEIFEFCFGGAINRAAVRAQGLPVWPGHEVPPGHMGIIPSDLGPGPLLLLQAGGLKVGEILCRARLAGRSCEEAVAALTASGWGHGVPVMGSGKIRT